MTMENLIEASVVDAIQKQIAEAKERIIKIATEDFRQDVRAIVGNVAVKLGDLYSVERLQAELIIHVKIEGK